MAWVCYKTLRKELDIAQVIADYDIELKGSGTQRKCMCPAPSCRDPKERTLSVNVEEGVFKCWKCDIRGNLIDFVALIEDLDPLDTKQFRQAALKLQDRYKVKSERPKNPTRTDANGRVHRRAKVQSADGKRRKVLVNEPLDFELKSLDIEHESVRGLGITRDTAEHFGLGFCNRRGMIQNRIAFPLHDGDGRLIGYGGLLPDAVEEAEDKPRYRYPEPERVRSNDNAVLKFELSGFLYNAYRQQDPAEDLLIVENPRLVWHLYEVGITNVVAVLGAATDVQRELITAAISHGDRIWFIANGQDARLSMSQVARTHSVRWVIASETHTVLEHAASIMA